jgi:sugar/nucleoside kinase (ribokinase family)
VTELELLNNAATKRVLFLGEYIIDVYHYVKPLGRPTKDSIISVELVRSEQFAGGIRAATAHAQELARVEYRSGGTTYSKERWVEESHFHKLFQCYRASEGKDRLLQQSTTLATFDLVAVIDYGHGMATKEFIDGLQVANYLAVNVQTNSGNYGFNLCTKYPRADYLCIDEAEARLATQNRDGDIEDSLRTLGKNAQKVVITLGKSGAIGCTNDIITRCPAFTSKVTDTMGAGDAFFAVTALIAEEADMMSLLRIGNAAGAIKANIVGHQRSITKDELVQYLDRVRKEGV